jgi:hypothetical protein
MLRNRINYWTCSKFADFIRGEKKPFALEWGAWDDYYSDLKKRKPIRYWIAEKLLRHLQNIIYYPYDLYNEIKFYIHNRWIDKTHYLKTGLRPGGYHEFDERILHGLFNELVDHVEIELAHLSRWDTTKKYKFKNGRCLEAVDDYFKWANNLKEKNDKGRKVLTPQAHDARRVQKLYEWWKNKRPNRPDPYEVSGWNKVCKVDDKSLFDSNIPISKQKKSLTKLHKIEQSYDDEDTEMLTELIKLRHNLWT